MPESPAVVVDGLVKRYGGRAVVDGLDLRAQRGAVTAVLGPNGAGKTTTVECCEGLRRADEGTVRVLGLDPHDPRLRARVGVMLQDGGLPNGTPARAVLDHVARMYAAPRAVPALATRLGIDAFARTTVRRLSGGQRQRLALACALVGDPEVLFLDEPGAGLDPQARQAVWELVREQRAAGVAVVLTTHQMDEAAELADEVVVVDHGTVVARGSVEALVAGAGPTSARLSTAQSVPLDAVRKAVGALTQVRSIDEHRVELSGEVSPAVLAALTAELARHGVLVREFVLGARTLEDVFLDLTGRELR